MNIQELTQHPELLNRETLYELRRMTAQYPYYQPARLLMIKNLYLLHDSTFDEELRRAAIYFTDRKVLFNLVEAAHYKQKNKPSQSVPGIPNGESVTATNDKDSNSRTVSLIDSFLSSIPKDEETKKEEKKSEKERGERRKPTAVDATVDYVAYLLATDFEELNPTTTETESAAQAPTTMNGGELIDAFINKEKGRITLQDEPEYLPEMPIADNNEKEPEEEFLTETLAGIYIKQGRYNKALDIMNRINNSTDKKNLYFEDQKRFLKKLIANQEKKKR